jgi:hypothetical protein
MTTPAPLLSQAAVILNKCGQPMQPQPGRTVDIPHAFLYTQYMDVPNNPLPPDTNEAKEVVGDAVFFLRAISGLSNPDAQSPTIAAPYVQVQFPDGRVWQQTLSDVNYDAGAGSGKQVVGETACPPGSKFFITLDAAIEGAVTGLLPPNDPSVGQTIAFLFEGVYRYYLAGGAGPAQAQDFGAAALPRYFNSPNQNIMAPEWMLSALDGTFCAEECPAGYQDELKVYSASLVFDSVNPVPQSLIIAIESSADFRCRRIFYQVTASNTPDVFQVRLRESLGYMYTSDYVPLVELKQFGDWVIPAGRSVYVDTSVQSGGGTGTTTLTVWLEGVRRFPVGMN